MKRIIAMLLALMLCLPLCACGDAGDEVQYYKPGETVSTDLVEFTLDEAEFAIALVNSSDRDTGLEKFFTPKEYDAEKDAKNPYVAAVGHTYAAITYTVNNLNRADTRIEGSRDFVTVTYNGEDYVPEEWDSFRYGAEMHHQEKMEVSNGSAYTYKPGEWHAVPGTVTSMLLMAGEKTSYRAIVDIPVEVESLTDDFLITFTLPNSDETTSSFTYLVTQADAENAA